MFTNSYGAYGPIHSNHNQTMLQFSQGIPAITHNVSASSGGGSGYGGYTNTQSNSSSSSGSGASATQKKLSNDFAKQLAAIKKENAAAIKALNDQLSDQQSFYDEREATANNRIDNLSATVRNAQSQYDPTKGMSTSNNINPALTIQEKTKKLSSGTQRYNRNNLNITNLNV
jgi:hypothetical protein